ncbi:Zinc transporter ZIP11 [Liparis tanakae]|uniref:Zinc transporter ZIP11 n=1 Tax=Liparis tanakae TaxID=230148 RepID=A0A4Z2EC29_9TELE|nr:Zinc transporter ZIP11 [Liparis tanakae]
MPRPKEAEPQTNLAPPRLSDIYDKIDNGDAYQRRRAPPVAGGADDQEERRMRREADGQAASSWRRIVLLILAITIHNIPGLSYWVTSWLREVLPQRILFSDWTMTSG